MIRFVQIAVASVVEATLGGPAHRTNELYALDDEGRIWRHPDAWSHKAVGWELFPMPDAKDRSRARIENDVEEGARVG